jgi:hypothetical protein
VIGNGLSTIVGIFDVFTEQLTVVKNNQTMTSREKPMKFRTANEAKNSR